MHLKEWSNGTLNKNREFVTALCNMTNIHTGTSKEKAPQTILLYEIIFWVFLVSSVSLFH